MEVIVNLSGIPYTMVSGFSILFRARPSHVIVLYSACARVVHAVHANGTLWIGTKSSKYGI